MSSLNIEGNISGSQKRGFQPVYNKEVEPGDIKLNAVYKSDIIDGIDPAYSKTNKNDTIKKEIIDQADFDRSGYGIIGPDAINPNNGTKQKNEVDDAEEIVSEEDEYESKEQKRNKPLSIGKWMLTIIVLCIPVINVIFLLVWTLGKGNRARQNFCRALLILLLIVGIIISGILYFVGATEVVDFFDQMLQEYNVKEYLAGIFSK